MSNWHQVLEMVHPTSDMVEIYDYTRRASLCLRDRYLAFLSSSGSAIRISGYSRGKLGNLGKSFGKAF